MKNLEIYGLHELSDDAARELNGGSGVGYWIGYTMVKGLQSLRDELVNTAEEVVKAFEAAGKAFEAAGEALGIC